VTGERGWTEEEEDYGTSTSGNAGAEGGAVPKAGHGGDRAATGAAAAQLEYDTEGEISPKGREQ
jgi:hypothetical protein